MNTEELCKIVLQRRAEAFAEMHRQMIELSTQARRPETMNSTEAMNQVWAGKKMRRPDWKAGCYIERGGTHNSDQIFYIDPSCVGVGRKTIWSPSFGGHKATDWQEHAPVYKNWGEWIIGTHCTTSGGIALELGLQLPPPSTLFATLATLRDLLNKPALTACLQHYREHISSPYYVLGTARTVGRDQVDSLLNDISRLFLLGAHLPLKKAA